MDSITELFQENPFNIDYPVEKITEYYRKKYAEFQASGGKPQKEKPVVDLKSLGLL